MSRRLARAFFSCCLFTFSLLGDGAFLQGQDLILVQPGYPGSTEEAKPFVEKLREALVKASGLSLAGGIYHNDEDAGLEAISASTPRVGIVSPGFYLKHREKLALRPIARSQPEGPVRILVRKGAFSSTDELRGKKVAGTPLLEPEILERLLYASPGGKEKMPEVSGWKLSPSRYASRALRYLGRSRRDAVLISDPDYRGARKLGLLEGLEVLHTSAPLPSALVVAFDKKLDVDEREKLKGAFLALQNSTAGKELLETMGIERFAAVDAKRWAAFQERFDAGAKDAKTEPSKSEGESP